jgi:elongator complex protein 4
LAISDQEAGKDLVKGCMWVVDRRAGGKEGGSESEGEGIGDEAGRTKIAWRYEKMRKFQTTVTSSSQTGMSRFS